MPMPTKGEGKSKKRQNTERILELSLSSSDAVIHGVIKCSPRKPKKFLGSILKAQYNCLGIGQHLRIKPQEIQANITRIAMSFAKDTSELNIYVHLVMHQSIYPSIQYFFELSTYLSIFPL